MPGTILILEHTAGDGPAHFGEWLTATGRPMRLVQIHAGDPVPRDLGDHAGVCVLGGPMSANDPLPHLHQELALIELALAADVPVIGHCLGAQLLAKALGAAIGRSPAPEIGWYPLTVQDTPAAREWFGAERAPWVMQWHREAFALPAGATPLAGSAACPQQAFVWRDRHLAVQFHPEADRDKIELWLRKQAARRPAAPAALPAASPATSPPTHSPERIRADTAVHLAGQRRLAFRLYRHWARQLRD